MTCRLYVLLVALFSFASVARAILYAGCYEVDSAHGQASSTEAYSGSCATICAGYYPGRTYAYDWIVWGEVSFYPYCWCTNRAPEAQYFISSDNCYYDQASVYIVRQAQVQGWTEENCAYAFENDTTLATVVPDVPACLTQCSTYTWATWRFDFLGNPDQVHCRCYNTVQWERHEVTNWCTIETQFIYRHTPLATRALEEERDGAAEDQVAQ